MASYDPAADRLSAPLLERLERIRRRARRMLLWHEVLAVLAAALVAFGGLAVLDYLLWFPAALRLVGMGAASLLVVVLARRRVVPALWSHFGLLDVATRIEQRFPQFDDRLVSAVSFHDDATTPADPLRRRLIERTTAIASDLPLEDAISMRPLRRMVGMALAPTALVMLTAALWPTWMTTAATRLALPFGHTTWPRRVAILPDAGVIRVARGQSAMLGLTIARGMHAQLRPTAVLARPGERPVRLTMHREGDARFVATVGGSQVDQHFWFEAGDDSTQRTPGRIEVVDRPVVESLILTVLPPDYVDGPVPRTVPAGQAVIDVILGSRIAATFRSSSMLVRTGPAHPAILRLADDTVVAAAPTEEPSTYHAVFEPHAPGRCTIELTDPFGFENIPPRAFTINLRADAPPTVTLSHPSAVVEATPTGTVPLRAEITDDLGISAVGLTVLGPGDAAPRYVPLSDWSAQPQRDRVAVDFVGTWDLRTLEANPGDTYEFAVVADDNRVTATDAAQQGRSQRRVLRIVTAADLARRIGEDLQQVATRLRALHTRQRRTVDQAEATYDGLSQTAGTESERVLHALSTQQRELLQELTALRRAAQRLADDLAANGIRNTRTDQQARLIVDQLRDGIEPPLHEAANQFSAARSDDPQERRERVAAGVSSQRAGTATLAELLDEITVWDDFNSVLAHVRELIDVQQEVSQQTAVLQVDMLGEDLADLDAERRERIEHAAAGQDRVSEVLDEATRRINELQERLRTQQPDEARALVRVAERLRDQRLRQESSDAAAAIRQNRTGQAQSRQNHIEQQLVEAAAQLETTRDRRLDDLAKQLAALAATVQALIDQQHALRDATAQDPEGTLEVHADPQHRLADNTRLSAARIAREARDSTAEPELLEAATLMDGAVTHLYAAARAAALERQDAVLSRLDAALAALEAWQAEAERQRQAQRLFAVQRALRKLRRAQHDINTETTALIEAASGLDRVHRRLARKARSAGESQDNLIVELRPLHEQLVTTPIYAWSIERVEAAMGASRDALRRAQLDATLPPTQLRVLALLDQLIEALKQVQAMAEQQFAQGSGGGGGAGGPGSGQQVAVPRVAELLVLKSLQQDIMDRTAELAVAVGDRDPSETDLVTMTAIGADQARLQRLTHELTAAARAEAEGAAP